MGLLFGSAGDLPKIKASCPPPPSPRLKAEQLLTYLQLTQVQEQLNLWQN